MRLTRRNALTTIATTSIIGLTGCANQMPGSQTNDDPDETEDSTDESNNELGVRTGGFTAENFETIEFTGEVTGLGKNESVEAGIQIRSFYADDWYPRDRRQALEFENLAQPREYTWELEETIWGGGDYEYRAVVNSGSREEPLYGETKTFNLQDLDIDTPDVQFGDAILDSGDPAVVEIPIENASDVTSGEVRGDVQWFDSNGTYLGDSYGRVYFLRGGEEGVLRVSSYADGITQDSLDNFDYSTRYYPVFEPIDGMEVVSSSMSLAPRRNITGTATNELSDPPSYVEAVARFFDSDGVLIGNIRDRQTTSDVPAGSDWEFEVRILQNHVEFARAADSYEVVLLES